MNRDEFAGMLTDLAIAVLLVVACAVAIGIIGQILFYEAGP